MERYNYLIGNESDLQNKVSNLVDLFNNFILGYLDSDAEMKTAIDVAGGIGAEIVLIDRDIQIPIFRFFNNAGRIKGSNLILKSNYLYNECGGSFEELEDVFKELSPSLYEENFNKRTSAFIAQKLLDIKEKNVVAVVRAKNKENIQYYLDHPDEIPPMDELLDSSKTKKKGFFT